VGLDVNAGMLTVARELTAGRPIEWVQADAAHMPLGEAQFDVAICQMGLPFMPEPWTALREIHRVLAPRGRLALSVWRPLEYTPGYVAFANALDRHAGPEAGDAMRSPFPPWDLAEVRDLIAGAGFGEVNVFIAVVEVRWPSALEWVEQEGASAPFAGAIDALGGDGRSALAADPPRHADDAGIVFPIEVYAATAVS